MPLSSRVGLAQEQHTANLANVNKPHKPHTPQFVLFSSASTLGISRATLREWLITDSTLRELKTGKTASIVRPCPAVSSPDPQTPHK